jgi:CRISPR-associated protein Cas2
MKEVQHKLEKIMDQEKDSLRYYYLGSNYKNKVEHVGAKPSYDMEGPLMI